MERRRWYRTGDVVVRRGSHGLLYYRRRGGIGDEADEADEAAAQVKVAGHRVELGDVEAAVKSITGETIVGGPEEAPWVLRVLDAAVVAVPRLDLAGAAKQKSSTSSTSSTSSSGHGAAASGGPRLEGALRRGRAGPDRRWWWWQR